MEYDPGFRVEKCMKKYANISPPRLADRFFQWYCCERLSETILGDLHEHFYEYIEKKGPWKARVLYWMNVLRFINRHTLKRERHPNQHFHSNNSAMIRNYILIALRRLRKNKVYASINIFGLAIGLASCLVIFFYVTKELTFDTFHEKSEQIYRVTNHFERSSGSIFWARTPPALAPGIRNNIPGIDKVTRLRYADDHTYSVGEKIFSQGNVFYADSLFFRIFDFNLKSGNPATALNDPNTIVITEQMATKYFGDEDPMGQLITFDNNQSLLVTGVLEAIPNNSHITFDMLISFETFRVPEGYLADLNSWSWAGFHTYILLAPGIAPESINDEIVKLYNQNFNRANITASTELQPLATIYLESGKYTNVGESIRTGNKATIFGLSMVAVLILIIAGFNFMNLSTASSLGRGKEIGIRKVMGAVKGRIALQFLIESVIVSLISLIIAYILIFLSQSYFKEQLGIDLPALSEYILLTPLIISATLLIGVLSGLYPSAILSAFSPISALKGGLKTGKTGATIRNGLMIFQFVISLVLIAGSIVIVSQMEYIGNKYLGFDKENVLRIKILSDDMARHYATLKNRFEQHPKVLQVAMSTHVFDGSSSSGPARLVGAPEDQSYQLAYYQTDYDFRDLTKIELVEGRFFSRDFPSDSTAILLNEKAVAIMELEKTIGTKMDFSGAERSVIGVFKDFHFSSLHTDIGPMAIVMPFGSPESILIRLAPGELTETLMVLENEWKSIVGTSPFDATFVADGIQMMYEQERKLSSLINLFSVLAIVLACLGLYGLVTYSVQSKLKEVGIRKVLGSSLKGLLIVLSRQFVILILIAVVLACPLIYYLSDLWLEDFAYRINVQWWIYVFSGMVLLIIALITISHQSLKAARMNPVKILRNE